MQVLSILGSVLAFVSGLVVLVKLFQKEGILKGILGLICMLYTFIWGWTKVNDPELNIKNWMYIWSAMVVLGVILNVIASTAN